MSSIAVSDQSIIIAKGLQVDCYDFSNHTIVGIESKFQDSDVISDVAISPNGEHLAAITSTSKQLLIYDFPLSEKCKHYVLPRSASKIRFTGNGDHILVADKSGDVLIYNIKEEDAGTKLLGHLSLLLDVLQTHDGKYIISCDRDEKIKVSCYPNTYNIQTYCLGHKEFVNHIELLPHNNAYLTSTSGDGTIIFWDYVNGNLRYSINTYLDVNDPELKESFTKAMDGEGIEVEALPILHYGITQLDETTSLLAVTVYSCKYLLLYTINIENNKFRHNLIQKLELERAPSAIKCHNSSLYVYDDNNNEISIYNIIYDNLDVKVKLSNNVRMFNDKIDNIMKEKRLSDYESIKILYKRKFDNVQEYQERKKQRLEKLVKIIK